MLSANVVERLPTGFTLVDKRSENASWLSQVCVAGLASVRNAISEIEIAPVPNPPAA